MKVEEIRYGYKQTKLGWLPDDWELHKLGKLVLKIGSGITPKGGESVYKTNGRPFVRSQNVGWGVFILEDIAFIDEKTHNSFPSTEIKEKDVLLNITGASIGRCAVADKRIAKGNVNQHVCIIRPNGTLEPFFLSSFILSKKGQNLIDSFQAGGNRQGLNFEQIRSFWVPLPPLHEQLKIAQIFNTWDWAITKTEQLIAKKQERKKGLMQQLLTGNKRFKEFVKSDKMKETKLGWIPEDWEVIEIGRKGNVISGLTYSPDDVRESGTLVLRSSNVQNDRLAFENNVFVDGSKYPFNPVEEGDILICVRNGSRGLIGKNTLITKKVEGVAFGAFMTVFRSQYYKYFIHLFKTNFWNKEIHKNLGATINSINGSNLKKFKFPFPEEKKELEKIASFLSTADHEISSLQNQLDYLKEQKKGLMQKLLTGEVRTRI